MRRRGLFTLSVWLMILLAACMPDGLPSLADLFPTPTRSDETVIPFTTIITNDIERLPEELGHQPMVSTSWIPMQSSEEAQRLHAMDSQVFLVTRVEELAPFLSWLAPEAQAALQQVDFSRLVVIGYFPMEIVDPSVMPYIHRLAARDSGELVVYGVTLITTGPVPAVEIFPYHIILVERQNIPFLVTAETPIALVTTTRVVSP